MSEKKKVHCVWLEHNYFASYGLSCMMTILEDQKSQILFQKTVWKTTCCKPANSKKDGRHAYRYFSWSSILLTSWSTQGSGQVSVFSVFRNGTLLFVLILMKKSAAWVKIKKNSLLLIHYWRHDRKKFYRKFQELCKEVRKKSF